VDQVSQATEARKETKGTRVMEERQATRATKGNPGALVIME
jgi:hypothetical protein